MTPVVKWLCFALVLVFLCSPFPVRAHDQTADDDTFADLIEEIKPSIVAVGTYYFNDVPKAGLYGTGFAVSDGNRIVTNYHVISEIIHKKRQAYLRIFHKSFGIKGIRVKIVAIDKFHDLAILELQQDQIPLTPLKIASPETVREGYRVIFSGYPIGLVLGLNLTSHTGIISAIAPLIRPSPSARIIDGKMIRHLDNPYSVLQIDATAFPGNSGSPVIRVATGEVVGVINQVFVKGKKERALTHPSGITYAIPARFIRELEKTILPGS